MTQPMNDSIGAIEELVQRVESLPDRLARTAATELVQAVMGLHESALRRIVEIVSTNSPVVLASLADDELVSSVLALHDLHPEDLEARIHRVMGKLHRYFDSRGGQIELIAMTPELVRVRVSGRNRSPESKQMIEDAFAETAPEVTNVVVEGMEEERDAGFVPLADLVATQHS